MTADKYSALWVSHSSLSDFIKCPRAYFLKNVYKDPKTGHKIQVASPAMSLGSAVHEVLESLSVLPAENRFDAPLPGKFDQVWKKYAGLPGGFVSSEVEAIYRGRGEAMIARVVKNPGILTKKAVKMKQDLPYYWISPDDNIILCGKIDWLTYIPESNSVKIVDFKTGKQEEDPHSLQLPIYHLIVHNCQHHQVLGASYWYLEYSDTIQEKTLPDLEEAHTQVLKLAKRVKLARQLNKLDCPTDGCLFCKPYEEILKGNAKFVCVDQATRKDTYVLARPDQENLNESVIL